MQNIFTIPTKSRKEKSVPVKYNGNLLDNNKNLCAFDWITINLKGKPYFDELPENVEIEVLDYGTKVFKEVVTIAIDKIKFGTLTFIPRNPKMDKDLVQFKLDNILLYTLKLEEIKRLMDELFNTLEIKVSGVSRVDVAFDFEDSTEKFRAVIGAILSGDLLISGRSKKVSLFNEVVNTYGNTRKGLLEHNGIVIGMKSNARVLRIYNKSLEMNQVKYKHHIADYWKLGGFTDLENVWRFEYALTSKFIKDWGITYDMLFDEKMIIEIMKKAYNNHFELKLSTGKTEINKEPSFVLYDFSKIKTGIEELKKRLNLITETIQRSITSVKRQIKGLFRSHYSTGSNFFYDALHVHLTNYDLNDWFNQKEEEYLIEFQKQSLTTC